MALIKYKDLLLSPSLQRKIPVGHRTEQEGAADAKIRHPKRKPHTYDYNKGYTEGQKGWDDLGFPVAKVKIK